MRNIRLTISYDGAGFAGFQRQANASTVQAVLEDGLWQLTGEETRVIGAGRTDAGVHALGQVVNFRTSAGLRTSSFVPALNSLLPPEVAVLQADEVPEEFHARLSARSKTYVYRIWRSPVRPVFERRRVYPFARPMDLQAMAAATALLVGTHDFRVFRAAGSATRTSVRTVHHASWEERGEILSLTVTADGFLYRMVRNMAGTLIQVGLGKHPPEWVGWLLAEGRRSLAGPTLPACGLFLVRVEY